MQFEVNVCIGRTQMSRRHEYYVDEKGKEVTQYSTNITLN